MNLIETAAFYAAAAHMDSRLPEREASDLTPWVGRLKNVPAEFAEEILDEIYSTVQMIPLQPGHVIEAWEKVSERINADLKRINLFSKRAALLDPHDADDVDAYNELVDQYNDALARIPVRVAQANGFTPKKHSTGAPARAKAPAPEWFKALKAA